MSNTWKKMYNEDCDIYEAFTYSEDKGDLVWKRIIEKIDFSKKIVFEMGCGTGKYTEKLAGVVDQLFANDISPKMLERAKAKCSNYNNIKYILESAHNCNLPSNSVDIVFSAWGYVAGDLEFSRKLDQEFKRILRQNGEIWLIDNYYSGEFYGFMKRDNTKCRFAEEELGYELVDIVRTTYEFSTVDEAARIFGYIFGKKVEEYIRQNHKTKIENEVAIMKKERKNV